MTTTKQQQEQAEKNKKKENKDTSCLNNNSLIPAINESERFIKFLDKKFNLKLPNNYIVVINKASKSALGSFANPETKQHFINTTQELNTITLNTLHLKKCNPYEVLAHELTHLINYLNKVKDCSINQYHNKHFKEQAESLLLSTTKTNKGFTTQDNEIFNKMVKEEFKSNPSVFNVFQSQKDKSKVGSRLRLYICSCGVKVRVGKDDFKATCLDCLTTFERVEND